MERAEVLGRTPGVAERMWTAAVERGQGRPDARQLREMALSRLHAHTNLAMGTAAVRGEAFSWSEFKPQLEPLLELCKTMGHSFTIAPTWDPGLKRTCRGPVFET